MRMIRRLLRNSWTIIEERRVKSRSITPSLCNYTAEPASSGVARLGLAAIRNGLKRSNFYYLVISHETRP